MNSVMELLLKLLTHTLPLASIASENAPNKFESGAQPVAGEIGWPGAGLSVVVPGLKVGVAPASWVR